MRPVLLPSSAIAETDAIVDQNFEAAARLVGADVVDDEHEFGDVQLDALRHRHEDLAAAAEIGEPEAVGISDVCEQHTDGERFQRRLGRGVASIGHDDGSRLR